MNDSTVEAVRQYLPPEVGDCASYWDWMAQRLSAAGRDFMLHTQVSGVTIDGDRATAAFATGGSVPLRWTDGRWLLE